MKKYVFKPYDPLFPKLFEKEKARILSHVQKTLIIEHVGSTSVPNLCGKGIIDIAIAADDMNLVSAQLQTLGYELRAPHSTPERIFLRADLPDPIEGTRRYHIHIMLETSQEWKNFLFFRDYLRSHPDEAAKYAELKKQAAEDINEDGKKYRDLKAPLFKAILKKQKDFS